MRQRGTTGLQFVGLLGLSSVASAQETTKSILGRRRVRATTCHRYWRALPVCATPEHSDEGCDHDLHAPVG